MLLLCCSRSQPAFSQECRLGRTISNDGGKPGRTQADEGGVLRGPASPGRKTRLLRLASSLLIVTDPRPSPPVAIHGSGARDIFRRGAPSEGGAAPRINQRKIKARRACVSVDGETVGSADQSDCRLVYHTFLEKYTSGTVKIPSQSAAPPWQRGRSLVYCKKSPVYGTGHPLR